MPIPDHQRHERANGCPAAMLSVVVQRLAEAMASPPDPVLPAARIGARRPSSAADIPAVTVGVVVDAEHPRGVGRELRLDERGQEMLRGDVYAGLLELEVSAETPATLEQLTTRLQRRLTLSAEPVRAGGFLRLQPVRLDAAEQVLRQPAVGATFAVWRQQLGYRFACELLEPPSLGAGGPIQRVDVEVGDGLHESFLVPGGTGERRPADG
jgi:hypothetical protein